MKKGSKQSLALLISLPETYTKQHSCGISCGNTFTHTFFFSQISQAKVEGIYLIQQSICLQQSRH